MQKIRLQGIRGGLWSWHWFMELFWGSWWFKGFRVPKSGDYGGQIFATTGRDPNDQMLPIALTSDLGETKDSWSWFFGAIDILFGRCQIMQELYIYKWSTKSVYDWPILIIAYILSSFRLTYWWL